MGEGLLTEPDFASVRRPFDELRAGSSAIKQRENLILSFL